MEQHTRTRTRARNAIVFCSGDRVITVRKNKKHRFSVTTRAKGWLVTKSNLREETAVSHILRSVKGQRRSLIPRGELVRATLLLEEGSAKTNGVNWMALRMAGGSRPIILKAPGLFRHCLLHIEPIPDRDGYFNMRVVDPFTDRRTEPIEADSGQVEEAVRAFSPHNHE